jgi:pantothenate kinase type III
MFKKVKNKCIGIDISNEQIVACAVSKRGKVLHYVGFENDGEDLAQTIVELVLKLFEDSGIKKEEVNHISIGSSEETVSNELKDFVESELNIKCYITNSN